MRTFILSLAQAASLAQAYTVTVADLFMYKNIDPIVVPGQYKSHMHSFFGSDAVTINTNSSAELQKGCSTAENPNDFSVYWVPTLYLVESGTYTPIKPMRFSAYYVDIDKAEIAIPQDYRDLAGNAAAKSQADVESDAGISWFCENEATDDSKDPAAFPTKTCSTHMQTLLLFHDCVNPDTLESAYSKNPRVAEGYGDNWCPTGMYRIPRLRFSIRYDLRKILPKGWEGQPPLQLACGSSYCSHGDFIMGWLPEAAENMLQANSKRDFKSVEGPMGKGNTGSVCTGGAKDADPEHGTSDYLESVKMMGKRSTNMARRHAGRHRRG
ncbi:hypothetical protein BDV29DRAFT_187265 [Aspergillus leporis]|uniref:DUF1996 domain-containing protein n=1 Tax=Aspergillus leporis TaxID=41062 RepID=A0A5N5XF10_9EURO|nr:hypothetical protein BDV29DRAFT_187265 [Aspergillus leporis]